MTTAEELFMCDAYITPPCIAGNFVPRDSSDLANQVSYAQHHSGHKGCAW